ncbi:phosphopantothenoylcysteine decarboxylase [bacterium]|nr:phosphopantothenoylcysteine decarboxylase [bacterium]
MSQTPASVLLAVGGGIAAYKSAILCSRLVQLGHCVNVVMTKSAGQFVGNSTFSALSGHPVPEGLFQSSKHPLGAHIELAQEIDLMVVAPATANLIGKFANGIADDLVSTIYLQRTCPILVAPAMSSSMWDKPSVQRNMKTLREDGCHVIGPEQGWLSCRESGTGRMSEPDAILGSVSQLISRGK